MDIAGRCIAANYAIRLREAGLMNRSEQGHAILSSFRWLFLCSYPDERDEGGKKPLEKGRGELFHGFVEVRRECWRGGFL